ncbi:MAG: efflux RND transporter permease subunit, partial [Clostridia bacterium]
MNLVRLSVRRPVAASMAVAVLVLFGAVALQGMPVDLLPDVELPIAAVVTIYPGADPATVEAAVTAPLEDVIATVPGLVRLRSTSAENVSIITAEFSWKADLQESLKQLENNVAVAASFLPAGIERPVVLRTDPSQYPVLMVAVSGPGDAVQGTRAVESYVKPRLQQLPGVAAVQAG